MKVQFFGAADGVTGSKHFIQAGNTKILLDCGLFQGRRQESFEKNRNFPFDPTVLDAVILSHAHIDHSGALPALARMGFNKQIYTTPATADLCDIMLMDSAHIQERDIEFLKKRYKKRKKLFNKEPLYTTPDAEKAIRLLTNVPYHKKTKISDSISFEFLNAGHILGSAFVRLEITENSKKTILLFSGDVGRKHLPVIQDPEPAGYADVVIMETTYGARFHAPSEKISKTLEDIVNKVYKRNGKIIIPAFSVGRSQGIIYELHKLIEQKKIPNIPVYIDSPLTINATEVFNKHPECFDPTVNAICDGNDQCDPFGFYLMHYIRSVEESKSLNKIKKPCIIISASGMCEHGRILHHLANNIEDDRNVILIVGYQAEGTLGKKLVEKQQEIRIFGDTYRRRAEVKVINSFSAHADQNELIEFLESFDNKPSKIFLVHGERDGRETFKQLLENKGYDEIISPTFKQKFLI